MAQKIGNLAYTLARQILVKDKGGIASLPDQGQILSKVQDIFQMLFQDVNREIIRDAFQ